MKGCLVVFLLLKICSGFNRFVESRSRNKDHRVEKFSYPHTNDSSSKYHSKYDLDLKSNVEEENDDYDDDLGEEESWFLDHVSQLKKSPLANQKIPKSSSVGEQGSLHVKSVKEPQDESIKIMGAFMSLLLETNSLEDLNVPEETLDPHSGNIFSTSNIIAEDEYGNYRHSIFDRDDELMEDDLNIRNSASMKLPVQNATFLSNSLESRSSTRSRLNPKFHENYPKTARIEETGSIKTKNSDESESTVIPRSYDEMKDNKSKKMGWFDKFKESISKKLESPDTENLGKNLTLFLLVSLIICTQIYVMAKFVAMLKGTHRHIQLIDDDDDDDDGGESDALLGLVSKKASDKIQNGSKSQHQIDMISESKIEEKKSEESV